MIYLTDQDLKMKAAEHLNAAEEHMQQADELIAQLQEPLPQYLQGTEPSDIFEKEDYLEWLDYLDPVIEGEDMDGVHKVFYPTEPEVK